MRNINFLFIATYYNIMRTTLIEYIFENILQNEYQNTCIFACHLSMKIALLNNKNM